MPQLGKFALQTCFLACFFCNSVMASYIDFTIAGLTGNSTGTYTGSVDGIGFTLTSLGGVIEFEKDSGYDGTSTNGCQSGTGDLECNKTGGGRSGDGVGIGNDEITEGQTLFLSFDKAVRINRLEFLDLDAEVRAFNPYSVNRF